WRCCAMRPRPVGWRRTTAAQRRSCRWRTPTTWSARRTIRCTSSTAICQHTADLNGWEFGGQYFPGDTGFGILANYTIVNGDVNFHNAGDPGVEQFALRGLSDTANAVLMYEKYGISARLAYNWRDEYLIQTNQQGTNRNPYYVEAYDQLDLSVNYRFNTGLSLGFEVINLTGEDVRWHGRSDKQLIKLIDQSPRYMIGARYNF